MPFAPQQYAHVAGHSCAGELDYLLAVIEADFRAAAHAPSVKPDRAVKVDPIRLFEVARLNKLINILPDTEALLPPGCAGLAPRIGHSRLLSAAMNHRSLVAAAEISARLDAAGIKHVHLKGPLQQVALFGDLHRKPSADVDILVQPRDRAAATQLIVSEGYRAKDTHIALWWRLYLHELHFAHPQRGTMIDLHHGLGQPGMPQPRNLNGFIETAATQSQNGAVFHVPDARHRALLISLSIVKAFLGREPALSAVVDLRAAVLKLSNEDLRSMTTLAAAFRLDRIWMLALRLLNAVFPDTSNGRLATVPLFANLEPVALKAMIATPWVEGLDWPRRHAFLAELCGDDRLHYVHERLQSVLSELLRRGLEMPTRAAWWSRSHNG